MKRTEDFDSEPLGWVKADIDRALNRAGTALRDFHSDGDAGHLLQAREELHRVHGALNMLGKLDGLARLAARCEEILATPAPPPGKELLALLATGLEAIGGYLDDLLAGQPNRALRLWPVYRELGRADGRETHRVDLFYPDLAPLPQVGGDGQEIDHWVSLGISPFEAFTRISTVW